MGHSQLHKDCKHMVGFLCPLAPRGYDCQPRAATDNTQTVLDCCHRRKVQEGRIRQFHPSPRNINSSQVKFGTFRPEPCNWRDASSPCRNTQTLTWAQELSEQTKGKSRGSNYPSLFVPQDSMIQQPESINAPQFLCWFAIMLLLCTPHGL